MRETAKRMNEQLTQMRIVMPIIAGAMQQYTIAEIMEQQKQIQQMMDKMSPEEREAFEKQMKAQMDAQGK